MGMVSVAGMWTTRCGVTEEWSKVDQTHAERGFVPADLRLRSGGPLPAEGIGSSGVDRRRARGRDV